MTDDPCTVILDFLFRAVNKTDCNNVSKRSLKKVYANIDKYTYMRRNKHCFLNSLTASFETSTMTPTYVC